MCVVKKCFSGQSFYAAQYKYRAKKYEIIHQNSFLENILHNTFKILLL